MKTVKIFQQPDSPGLSDTGYGWLPGRCLDNAKMERFWWSLKYEDIKIKEYLSLPQLRLRVQSYVNFYNSRRIHSALEYKTPDEDYGQGCIMQSEFILIQSLYTDLFRKVVQAKG